MTNHTHTTSLTYLSSPLSPLLLLPKAPFGIDWGLLLQKIHIMLSYYIYRGEREEREESVAQVAGGMGPSASRKRSE